MQENFVNLTQENIENEHLCCIIRTKVMHQGVESKRQWLKKRLSEGHVFRKLNVKGTVFIEYAPLEKAWVPIQGEHYLYIYCLWVDGEYKGKGYGKQLLQYCIDDAKKNHKSGICLLGAKKQKHWLTNQAFMKKYGFKVVDETSSGYDLLALSFDGTYPMFIANAKKECITNQELTIYYDDQCPFIKQKIQAVQEYCETKSIPLHLNYIDSLEKAKQCPSVFNNYAVFYKGKFETVNILEISNLEKLLKK